MGNEYLSKFLSLKCCGDVLNIVTPMASGVEKEITESMAILKYIKDITLRRKMQLDLYDFCAGNALTSITAVHLYPIKFATAIDIKYREREWDKVKRFEYKIEDIKTYLQPDHTANTLIFHKLHSISQDAIIIGVHACGKLAETIIAIFNNSNAKYLFLMPCCHDQITNLLPSAIHLAIEKPLRWAYHLYSMIDVDTSDKNIIRDDNVLSPQKYIISAIKP